MEVIKYAAVFQFILLLRDAMRKHGLCCGPVSVRPSVCRSACLSVTFVHSIRKAEDIVELLCRPGSPIILVFCPLAPIPRKKLKRAGLLADDLVH